MKRSTIACIALGMAFSSQAFAQGSRTKSNIVPERFLRGYDPVTVFYDIAVPDAVRGKDGPSEYLAILPAVPGEFRWLDQRTVQFLPAVPWPPLESFTIKAKDRSARLSTMLVPPVSISPAPGTVALEPVSRFTLSFPAALKASDLSKMIRFEIRDLPGLTTANSYWIDSAGFRLAEMEASRAATSSSFRIDLQKPVPYGKHVIMRLKLSMDESIPDSVASYSFDTKPEFRLVSMGGGSTRLPVSAKGAAYTETQAVDCGTGSTPVYLEFSETLAPVAVETLKRMVRFEPSVRNLRHSVSGGRILLNFDADKDKPYRISVSGQEVTSASGRRLSAFDGASFYFYYRQQTPYVSWKASQGMAERFGPQYFPMEGRGVERIDLRVHRVDPLSLDYWPFPRAAVAIKEDSRPPMPGEEPGYGIDVAKQIRLLGSPEISRIVDLPLTAASGKTAFGLDLKPELASRFGNEKPGTYIVGYRPIGPEDTRYYVRYTVTDLCLSTVEEENAVVFAVSSLKTGAPVKGASVRVEYLDYDRNPVAIFSGTTDAAGQYRYVHRERQKGNPFRIIVSSGDDVLVLDPSDRPPTFANNHWNSGGSAWLSWLADYPRDLKHESATKAWMITERPVYRPEETVHLIGWVRDRKNGRIVRYSGQEGIEVVIQGSGDKDWALPATLGPNGSFSVDFFDKDAPTGEFNASIVTKKSRSTLASVSFRKESYRIPLFEVSIDGPDRVPLDKPFELVLTADYYSGGRVVGEDVMWDVTEYPYSIFSPSYPGFVFSTDERFSSGPSFTSGRAGRKADTLDESGSSKLVLNPAAEKDGRARRYVVEAMVQGADRQAVSQTKQVLALPPFSIGVRAERLVKDATELKPEIVVLDHAENPLAGKQVQLRVYQRQWHSYVAESDFTTGEVRYVTDVVDKLVKELSLVSTGGTLTPSIPVGEAGVYVIEASAKDYLGRQILVKTDLFLSGPTAVTWERKKADVFEMSADLKSYAPGSTARVLLKSPYQDGWALVVAELPTDNKYSWIRIENGQGMYDLPITDDMTPFVPLNALLIRGRVPGTERLLQEKIDLGRPASLGSSLDIAVDATANLAVLSLKHETKLRPAQSFKMRIELKDPAGKPLDGEVALWLVDKAVLSLGTELSLEPLGHFMDPARRWIRITDSRNKVIGYLPVDEMPGGGGDDEMMERSAFASELMNRTTVRKNFKTVPYFNPSIKVQNGVAEVTIELPDNLTDFAVRAVAVSGFERFGSAKSVVSVRLPVMVQSVLPRFVRPGDSFLAGGTARVTEGPGGQGTAAMKTAGLTLPGEKDPSATSRQFAFKGMEATRLLFPLFAPMTLVDADGGSVSVSLAARRESDLAADAFQIDLPIRADLETKRISEIKVLELPGNVDLRLPAEPVRKGSLSRTVILSRDIRIVRLIDGMRYLSEYPHGCLEQRVSKLYPNILYRDLLEAADLGKKFAMSDPIMADFTAFLESCQTESGLFGFWPGSGGSVSLTAYVVEFLEALKGAKVAFKPAIYDRAISALKQALRSDYRYLASGYSTLERVEALYALNAGRAYDEGYISQLLDAAATLPQFSQARLLLVLKSRNLHGSKKAVALSGSLEASVVTKLERGREIFVGVQDPQSRWGGPVLLSEVRTVAAVMEALMAVKPESPKIRFLVDFLVERATENGWGNTQDNVAALKALKASLVTGWNKADDVAFDVTFGSTKRSLSTGGKALAVFRFTEAEAGTLAFRKGVSAKTPLYCVSYTDYKPAMRGALVKAQNQGFASERELFIVNGEGTVSERLRAEAGKSVSVPLDAVVEEHVRIVNFRDADYVAVVVPFACGFEPLNPDLATSPKEAKPSGSLTMRPTWSIYGDDKVTFYYDALPKGSFDFYFRVRASFEGTFSEPPAGAELMYDLSTRGYSDGTEILITPEDDDANP